MQEPGAVSAPPVQLKSSLTPMEQVGDDRVCRIEDGNGIDLTAQWSTPDRLATFYDSRLWL